MCGGDPEHPVRILELDVSHATVDLAPLVNEEVSITGRATSEPERDRSSSRRTGGITLRVTVRAQ